MPMIRSQSLGWFGPPAHSSPELRRRARALWMVSWPFFVVVATVLGIAVLVEPATLARRATTIVSVGTLVILLHAISRAGRPMLASWTLVFGLSAIVTQRAWITGGIHAPVAVFYALFILMAGALLGARGAIVTAAACLLGAITLTVGTTMLWLTPRAGAGSPLAALIFVILAIGLALVIQMMLNVRSRRDAMEANAVNMLVHDMRSPIQVVMAHLDILREEARDENREDVEAAMSGAAALKRMTASLLDVARLDEGRMPVNRVATNVSKLARSVVVSVQVLQPARVLIVEGSEHCWSNCDPELLRRVIDNLVVNALKHTPVAGRVRVVVSRSRSGVSVAVHDEGPGISAAKRAEIYELFNADCIRSANGQDSWGLGLAFCKLAVEAHGGTIRIEDGSERGSVFVVEIPD